MALNYRLFSRFFSSQSSAVRVGIIGVPFNKGQKLSGVCLAPSALREASLIESIKKFNPLVDIVDYGDLTEISDDINQIPKNMKNYAILMGTMRRLSQKVQEIRSDARLCWTIGGDHSVAIGSISGHMNFNKNTSVIWIDAHTDINTNLTSRSGNIHGMPVALLLKEFQTYWGQLPGYEWYKEKLSLKHLVYIGIRSVDPYERLIMKKYNLHFYGMKELDKFGVHKVIEMALNDVDAKNDRDYHISFDIDALDRLEAPCTGLPTPGGLTIREGVTIVEEIFRTGRLRGVDLVEINPDLGDSTDVKRTIDSAIHLLKASCGTDRNGNLPNDIVDWPKPT